MYLFRDFSKLFFPIFGIFHNKRTTIKFEGLVW
jgi:hypothetical protein